jgi:Kelch motif
LADGRVIVWSSYARFDFGVNRGRTYTAIYDPATGAMTEQLVSNTGHDMFCPGTSMLADGRILVNGGSSSSKTSIFNPSTMTWSKSAAMNIPRGYQGTTLLSSGKVLTLGGSWNGGEGNKHAEIWISGVGWSLLPGVPIDPFIGPDPMGVWRGDNHLWLIAARDDWVFHAGPASQMHWIDTNGAAVSSMPVCAAAIPTPLTGTPWSTTRAGSSRSAAHRPIRMETQAMPPTSSTSGAAPLCRSSSAR